MKFHMDGSLPEGDAIFVFGSNLAGIHGAGAAKVAYDQFGARWGCGAGFGWDERSFAIPTKDGSIKTLPLEAIASYVNDFLDFARAQQMAEFFITRIGCGLAGYQDKDIAPMFKGAPTNCSFANEWREYLL